MSVPYPDLVEVLDEIAALRAKLEQAERERNELRQKLNAADAYFPEAAIRVVEAEAALSEARNEGTRSALKIVEQKERIADTPGERELIWAIAEEIRSMLQHPIAAAPEVLRGSLKHGEDDCPFADGWTEEEARDNFERDR